MNNLNKEEQKEITKKYRQIRVTDITQKVEELEGKIKLRADWYKTPEFRDLMDYTLQFPSFPADYEKEGWELFQPPIKELLKELILILKKTQKKYGLNFQKYIDYFQKALDYNI
jgi:3'-phosphoadenosine 5'-phosphosulfate sulfotransferase